MPKARGFNQNLTIHVVKNTFGQSLNCATNLFLLYQLPAKVINLKQNIYKAEMSFYSLNHFLFNCSACATSAKNFQTILFTDNGWTWEIISLRHQILLVYSFIRYSVKKKLELCALNRRASSLKFIFESVLNKPLMHRTIEKSEKKFPKSKVSDL